jgi:hypothetical protein
VKRQQEADLLVLMTALGRVSEPQLQLFFLLQSTILRFKPDTFTAVSDADVADAAGAIAASLETAGRGVVYEHQTTTPIAGALRRELKAVLDKIGQSGGSRFEREAAEVLRGIERGARHDTLGPGAGPRDYLSLVARVLQERPPRTDAPTLIVPG